MNSNLVIAIVMIWVILMLISGVSEGVYIGDSHASTLYQVMHPSGISFITALFKLFTFDLAMFTGGWVVFQWVFFAPLTAGLVIGLLGTGGIAGYVIAGILGINVLLSLFT